MLDIMAQAKNAIEAYNTALKVHSSNIANMNVIGYKRLNYSFQSIFEKLTAVSTNVELAKVALCDTDGPVEFFISDENSTMNSIVNKYGRSIDVEGLCLKSLLDKYNLDKVHFCKIDIEGSEMRAVTVETLGAVFDRIDEIFIECHATVPNFTHGDIIANRVKMEDVFKKVGYQVKVVNFDTIHAFKS